MKLIIEKEIQDLYTFAIENPQYNFYIGYCGITGDNLSGFSNQEFADLFSCFDIPENVIFEKDFSTLLNIL